MVDETEDVQQSLVDGIRGLLDIAASHEGVATEDIVAALAQCLYKIVAADNPVEAGKVLSVHVEPFDCGCLCVSVGATDPLPGFADSCEEAS